jgi:hypothetical protein
MVHLTTDSWGGIILISHGSLEDLYMAI